MNRHPKAIAFDLDGTISDPSEGIVGSLAHAVRSVGGDPPPESELRQWIGPPLRVIFAELLDAPDSDTIEEAVRSYREHYWSDGLLRNELFQGMDALIVELQTPCYVITSKITPMARQIISHFNLTEQFEEIYGAEENGRFDDKGELVAHVIRQHQIVPSTMLMVGDRASDIDAANRNGVTAIGVSWGFGSERELAGSGAAAVVHTPEELREYLSR